MNKIKTNDTVIVLTGKDKGRTGRILKFVGKNRVLVEGVNLVKKHVRGNPNTGQEGGILDREAGIHISNVAVYNPQTKKADRVGIRALENGKKVRYFKSNDEVIDI